MSSLNNIFRTLVVITVFQNKIVIRTSGTPFIYTYISMYTYYMYVHRLWAYTCHMFSHNPFTANMYVNEGLMATQVYRKSS